MDPGSRRPTTYWDYIRVEELLRLQLGTAASEDELIDDEVRFIVIHQIDELWFKLVLRELVAARNLFAKSRVPENALAGALSRLMVVVEQYPQLKATGNVGQLQEELTSTENRISFARQLYNDTATQYNTKQAQFPTNVVAGLAKASPADLWEIEHPGERAVPAVDLSMKPRA